MRFPRIRTWVVTATMTAMAAGCQGSEAPSPPATKTKVAAAAPAPVTTLTLPPVAPEAKVAIVEPPAASVPLPAEAPFVLPDGYRARMKYAKQLAREGRADDAEVAYAAAAELEPTHAAPRIEIARLRLDAQDVGAARKHAEAAVELEPGSSGAWNTLGRVELMDGDKLAAVAAFARATDANPDNSFAWNNLGLVLSQLGRWDEAVAALEHATGGERPEPYMWNNLGQAYERSDKLELARAAYRQGAKAGSKVAEASLARLEGVTSVGVGVQAKAEGGAPGVDETPTPPPDAGPR
jgi:Flp pilus assembly protein TadD